MNLQDIRNLIGKGDTDDAIKAMLNLVQEGAGRTKRLRDDLLILSNQLQELKRKESIGVLDADDARQQSAQLNSALLNVIDEMESRHQTESEQSAPPAFSIQNDKKRLVLMGLGIVTIVALIAFFVFKRGTPNTIQSPTQGAINKNTPSSSLPPTFSIHSRLIQDTVFVEGGIYEMGSNNGEEDEHLHTVVVNSFYIDKHEVTNEQYAAFLNAVGKHDTLWIDLAKTYRQERCRIFHSSGAYKIEEGYEKHPVINVNFAGALAYAQYYGMRLPTEAEWEYAARGGNIGKNHNYKFSGSNTIGQVAWYPENANGRIHAVKTKAPNELGIFDMSGNLYEWCSDYYAPRYYFTGPRENPECVVNSNRKVVRGGNVFLAADFCRVANRGFWDAVVTSPGVGFRCVKDK